VWVLLVFFVTPWWWSWIWPEHVGDKWYGITTFYQSAFIGVPSIIPSFLHVTDYLSTQETFKFYVEYRPIRKEAMTIQGNKYLQFQYQFSDKSLHYKIISIYSKQTELAVECCHTWNFSKWMKCLVALKILMLRIKLNFQPQLEYCFKKTKLQYQPQYSQNLSRFLEMIIEYTYTW
jgi:hypothetical protein